MVSLEAGLGAVEEDADGVVFLTCWVVVISDSVLDLQYLGAVSMYLRVSIHRHLDWQHRFC